MGREVDQGRLARIFFRFSIFCSIFLFILHILHQPAHLQVQVQEEGEGEATIFGWSANTTRDLRVYIQPHNDIAVISATNICSFPSVSNDVKTEKKGEEDSLLLLVVVCSSVANFEARQAIRETWASKEAVAHDVRVAFLLGNPTPTLDDEDNITVSSLQFRVNEESRLHSDIIQEGFVDTYNNLTLKSVMLLKWALQHCSSVQYIMKTDDDMFVNVGAIVAYLRERVRQRKWQQRGSLVGTEVGQPRGPRKRLIPFVAEDILLVGSLIHGAQPISNPISKWYVPKYMYSDRVYPDYLAGAGYIMSRAVAKRLYLAALSIPLLHIEDVFVTGICARKSGLRPMNQHRFNYQRIRNDDLCGYRNTFTAHRFDAAELRLVWLQIQSHSLQCPVTSLG